MQKFGLACVEKENITIKHLLYFYQIYFIGKIIITQLLMQLKIFYHFNDYYVEKLSQIRANTSPNTTVDNIIKQAYVISIYAVLLLLINYYFILIFNIK